MVEQDPRKQRPTETAAGGDSLMRRAREQHEREKLEGDPEDQPHPKKQAQNHPMGFSPVEVDTQRDPAVAQPLRDASPGVHKQQEVQLPTILDSQGQVYDERPDVIIMNYAKRAALDEDEYSAVQHFLGLRRWTDLRNLLSTLLRKREGDNAIRLEKAIETIDTVTG